MSEPDDRELEQYLKGNSPLSRRYRDAGGETAPPELDEAILAQARRAVRLRPLGINRWLTPVALAASVLLGVNLGWNVYKAAPAPGEPRALQDAAEPARPAAAPLEPPAADVPAVVAPTQPGAPEARAESPPTTDEMLLADRDLARTAAREEDVSKAEAKSLASADIERERRSALARRRQAENRYEAESHTSDSAAAGASAAAPASPGPTRPTRALPPQWFIATNPDGARPTGFEAGTDVSVSSDGDPSLYLFRARAEGSDRAALMTRMSPEPYRGKRVRLSADVRTQGVTGWSGVWMRIDGPAWSPGSPDPVAFDNMANRPIRGETSWHRYSVVLDVPPTAANIAHGVVLSGGSGIVWLDNVKLEEVGGDVPVTDLKAH